MKGGQDLHSIKDPHPQQSNIKGPLQQSKRLIFETNFANFCRFHMNLLFEKIYVVIV